MFSKVFYAVEAITRGYETMWEDNYKGCINYLQEYGYTPAEARIIKYKIGKEPKEIEIGFDDLQELDAHDDPECVEIITNW